MLQENLRLMTAQDVINELSKYNPETRVFISDLSEQVTRKKLSVEFCVADHERREGYEYHPYDHIVICGDW